MVTDELADAVESHADAYAAAHSTAYAAVSNVLWSERETLELLLFKLVTEQLVVSAGSTRWLNRADSEVRAVIDRMRATEIIRAAEVDVLARALDLPLETTLGRLAEQAPEPWGSVLAEHRTVLRQLVAEIEAVAAENRRLLDAGAKAMLETLDQLGAAVSTVGGRGSAYDAKGESVTIRRGPILLDQQV